MTGSQDGARHAALSAASRRRLLSVLIDDGPMDVTTLAETVGLHVTTARFHLDVLQQAGLIRRTAGRAGRPGRPRQLYAATATAEPGEAYRQLAAALTEVLATDPDAGPQLAERAGRHWAQMEIPVEEAMSWEEGTRRISDLFERIGFAPRLVDDTAERHLELDACPFRDLARAYPEIVCRAHLGLLRGSLDRLGVPGVEEADLRPFVEPELCVADVPTP
ncbi:helix-turn-helix transcriptional regulator [Gulosibacter sediminis]|uniref:helix-turn-helix transcriptional regulator n=1 Tax=Gulosibacter sediminis TaxID=1729695 RepID=UPI0024A8AAAE|nr:helix-turn-helix domain-containing protein [Gulosibacter sediminis]